MILNVQIINTVVAAREITKGLGFSSGLAYYNNVLPSNMPYVAPKLHSDSSQTYFEPPSVLDSLLYANNLPVLGFTNSITMPTYTNINKELFMARMEVLPSNKDACSDLYVLATSPNLVARLPQGDLPLYSVLEVGGKEVQYQTILQSPQDPEFLMSPLADTVGRNLISEMVNRNMKHIYGPKTLQVLEAIGYPTAKSVLKLDAMEVIGFRLYNSFHGHNLIHLDSSDPELDGSELVKSFDDSDELSELVNSFDHSDELDLSPIKLDDDFFNTESNPKPVG